MSFLCSCCLKYGILKMYIQLRAIRKTLKTIRSSRAEVFCKRGVLKNFIKFTEKHLRWSLFFNKVTALQPATLLKRDSNTGAFL